MGAQMPNAPSDRADIMVELISNTVASDPEILLKSIRVTMEIVWTGEMSEHDGVPTNEKLQCTADV